jgi:hypothetical protein
MKVLLLDPDDDPNLGPWAQQPWNRVVDLGIAGQRTYESWSKLFYCPVEPLPKLGLEDFKQVREVLFSGLGRVVDTHGFDWWELISIEYHERVERVLGLQKLAAQIGRSDEVFVSRDGFDRQVIEILLGRVVRWFVQADSAVKRMRRKFGSVSKLGLGQIRQILGDKYDADYRIRRFTSRHKKSCERPVVLLPTAYVNVSRTGLGYAAALPDRDYLLVSTRQSGWVNDPPKNVAVARLASYAPGKFQKDEYEYLLDCWRRLQTEFHDRRELFALNAFGTFECVPAMLRDGLAIRDAWVQVFAREPVTAVLCADDSNTYTRLPLLIARERGLPAIACHHGALDGRHLIKRNHADFILAKGRMEQDYLTRVCGVAREQVEVGAPPGEGFSGARREKGSVVFFSESYEVAGGRCIEFYREILPSLAEIAAASQCEVVVKLHPQESLRQRESFVNAVLTAKQREGVRVVEGRLSEQLLAKTWFAVTVLSTTAVDCTLRGIPVFLCTWLEYSSWRYGEQFVKFGAGAKLSSPDEIPEIPRRVEDFAAGSTRDLWQPIAPERLDRMLSANGCAKVAAAV